MNDIHNEMAAGVGSPGGLQEITRNYQREMFEESLCRNIIVAMDTGSGKTHIAILRLWSQLEKGDGKLCWFLVPTASLGHQQFELFQKVLPPVNMQFLTGASGVDKWSNKETWDSILGDREGLIVSTHMILLDALRHGFVSMERIGLLVFDEAHHCITSHPANRIMQEFYHPRRQQGCSVPDILGLSASPIISAARADELRQVELNMNAIVRTPIHHRTELLAHVQPSKLKIVTYKEGRLPCFPPTAAPSKLIPSQAISSRPSIPQKGWLDHLKIDFGPPFEVPRTAPVSTPAISAVQNNDSARGKRKHAHTEDDEYECIEIDPTILEPPQRPASLHLYVDAPRREHKEKEFESISPDAGIIVSSEPSEKSFDSPGPATNLLAFLRNAYHAMDIEQDPYVLSLKRKGPGMEESLRKTIRTRNTYCHTQIKSLVNKALHINDEFGEWPTTWFIKQAIMRYLKCSASEDDELDAFEQDVFNCMKGSEKEYLRAIFEGVPLPKEIGSVEGRITHKTKTLIDILLQEYEGETTDFSGLIFVQQRVGVVVLVQLLQEHPKTRDVFKVGGMTGNGPLSSKSVPLIHDLVSRKHKDTLSDFRTGAKNLIVATSVIEEGIDIRTCHLVVCHSVPQNLKSFIQRRGRARRAGSSYVILVPEADGEEKIREFEELEREMIALYSDQTRELDELEQVEESYEEVSLYIESTGALLTLDGAIPHLQHFCACIPNQEFVNSHAEFKMTDEGGVWRAEVILPPSIHPDIRRTSSRLSTWTTERYAQRDAAFEAFIKLHSLGLVDNHLMPLIKTDLGNAQEEEKKRAPKAEVEETMDVWRCIGQKWAEGHVYEAMITVVLPGGDTVAVKLLLPVSVPPVRDFTLYWTNELPVNVTIGPSKYIDNPTILVERARRATYQLFENMFSTRFTKNRMDFPYLFAPADGERWDERSTKAISALEAYRKNHDIGVVTDSQGLKYTFSRWQTDIGPSESEWIQEQCKAGEPLIEQPILECKRLLTRRDFLHRVHGGTASNKTDRVVRLLPHQVTMDTLPWRYSQLALLLPCIIDRIEKTLLAADLQRSLLSSVPALTTPLVQHATAASSAQEPTDYQRLEFLGDSVLKLLTSVTLVDEHPLWHEGYLSGAKDRIVSNTASSAVAIEKHLSRWIVTKPFTAQKWRPKYIEVSTEAQAEKKTPLSTKILADVVEALIGASYLCSGFEGAEACCTAFGFKVNWRAMKTRVGNLLQSASLASQRLPGKLPDHYVILEGLVGYTFTNKILLLEAMTHLSYDSDSSSMSYQRLEFLGDAVLDMVVVDSLFHHRGKEISHFDMHLHKSALVNAHFLAYLCLGVSTEVERNVAPDVYSSQQEITTRHIILPLYRFLRHNHSDIPTADARCAARYRRLKDQIKHELETSAVYPWVALLKMDAPKHLSDIIESLIAAIWIDTAGSFAVVKAFLDRLGIMAMLDRIVETDMNTDHPSSRFGKKVANGGMLGVTKYNTTEEENGSYTCELSVNGELIAKVENCISRPHARAEVAQKGLQVIVEREARGEWPVGKPDRVEEPVETDGVTSDADEFFDAMEDVCVVEV